MLAPRKLAKLFAVAAVLTVAGLGAGCGGDNAQAPVTSRTPVAWADWRPSEPVRDLPKFSESDKQALRKEYLADLAEWYGIEDPPDVALERWLFPDERGPMAVKCFAEAGFEVKSIADGQGVQVVTLVTGAQGQVLNMANYVCQARFSIDPTYTQWPTPDQMRVDYEYSTQVLAPCLRKQGYEVSEPPTLETFLATYNTADLWSPYSGIGLESLDSETYEALTEGVCHADPPAAARYGG